MATVVDPAPTGPTARTARNAATAHPTLLALSATRSAVSAVARLGAPVHAVPIPVPVVDGETAAVGHVSVSEAPPADPLTEPATVRPGGSARCANRPAPRGDGEKDVSTFVDVETPLGVIDTPESVSARLGILGSSVISVS